MKTGILSSAVGVILTAVFGVGYGCSDIVVQPLGNGDSPQPGAIGAPCVPPDESHAQYPGFAMSEENLVTNYFLACQSGVCLVNHFQGRVSCPLGQAEPTPCKGPSDTSCEAGAACVAADTRPVPCNPESPDAGASQCEGHGGVCNADRGSCECGADTDCYPGTACDVATKECKQYVCHHQGSCQIAGAPDAENEGKSCCAVGSDTPVSTAVCGQCSERSAADTVYCSCRCGPSDGAPPEPDAEYCTCPSGFECTEIRKYVGLGDASLTGKYCIKQGTAFESPGQCGTVSGYVDNACSGASP